MEASKLGPSLRFDGHLIRYSWYYDDIRLQYIGNYAFYGCTGFSNDLELPNYLYYIGRYAFADCTSLSNNITIKSGYALHIGKYAFNSTNFAFLNYNDIVEPSYEHPIALSKETTVIVPANYHTAEYYSFKYRSPSFCTYNAVFHGEMIIYPNDDENENEPITIQFSSIDEYNSQFENKLKSYEKIANTTRTINVKICVGDNICGDDTSINYCNENPESCTITPKKGIDEYDYIKYDRYMIINLPTVVGKVNLDVSNSATVSTYNENVDIDLIEATNGKYIEIISSTTKDVVIKSPTSIKGFNDDPFSIIVPENVENVILQELKLTSYAKIEATNNKQQIVIEVKNLTTEFNHLQLN